MCFKKTPSKSNRVKLNELGAQVDHAEYSISHILSGKHQFLTFSDPTQPTHVPTEFCTMQISQFCDRVLVSDTKSTF